MTHSAARLMKFLAFIGVKPVGACQQKTCIREPKSELLKSSEENDSVESHLCTGSDSRNT